MHVVTGLLFHVITSTKVPVNTHSLALFFFKGCIAAQGKTVVCLSSSLFRYPENVYSLWQLESAMVIFTHSYIIMVLSLTLQFPLSPATLDSASLLQQVNITTAASALLSIWQRTLAIPPSTGSAAARHSVDPSWEEAEEKQRKRNKDMLIMSYLLLNLTI